METFHAYIIPESATLENLTQKLSNDFIVRQSAPTDSVHTYSETFDWLLYKNDLAFRQSDSNFELLSLDGGRQVETPPGSSKKNLKFWWEFKESSLKLKLKKVIEARALLPLLTVKSREQELQLLNEDEKTVCHIQWSQFTVMRDANPLETIRCIQLMPVKGYDDELVRVKSNLSDWLSAKISFSEWYARLLHLVGRTPGDYTSKINLTLKPDMPSGQAAREILKYLFRTMRQNEEGIKADIDTEFLHDFRVAVRRTRSALGQIKGVFPPEALNHFKTEFAALGKLTNHMRDLDVYLLKQDDYRAMLPDYLGPGLVPFFKGLQSERKKELRRIKNSLESEAYAQLVSEWDTFLNSKNESTDSSTPNTRIPILNLARKLIRKRFKKIIAAGEAIDERSPDAALHRLRIECKKLRYLLEFFASLFPPKKMLYLIKHLKILQTHLGDFNDLSVQQATLKEFLKKYSAPEQNKPEIASAIGGLITHLFHAQTTLRADFSNAFAEFSDPETRTLVQKLFA